MQTLYMDCANGVGAPKMAALVASLAQADAGLAVDLRNTGQGVLNGGCGSDFLQKDRQLPANFQDVPPGARCCAVDGDSDRLMYFTPLEGGEKGEGVAGGRAGRLGPAPLSSPAPKQRQWTHTSWLLTRLAPPPANTHATPPRPPPPRSASV